MLKRRKKFHIINLYFIKNNINEVSKNHKDLLFFGNFEPGCQNNQAMIENSKNKFDNLILDIISHEMSEKNQKFKNKKSDEEEQIPLERIQSSVEQNKQHLRYKSLISKIPKENLEVNKSKIIPTHKTAQQNKSVDLVKKSEFILSKNLLNNCKSPHDPKVQNKALYGYFFPNNYLTNQSFINNNNISGKIYLFINEIIKNFNKK